MDNLPEQNPVEQAPDTSVADSLRRYIAQENGEDLPEETAPPETAQPPETAAPEEAAKEPETAPEAQAQPDGLVEVELEGKTYKVPPELKDGYLRQADYSKKTADVAREREAIAQARQVAEQALAITQNLGPLVAAYHTANEKAQQYAKVDFDTVYAQDPMLHNKLKLDQQENWMQLQTLGGQLQQAPAVLQELQARAHQAEVAKNLPKALEYVPDLSKRVQEFNAVAKEYGFTDQELNFLSDARYVKALRDLAEYKKLTKDSGTIRQQLASAPPVVKPGSRAQAPQVTAKEYNTAVRALKTDNSDDAFITALRTQRKLSGR